MTINPNDPTFGIPEPHSDGKPDCEHIWPKEWDYTHSQAGSMRCRKCGAMIYD